MFRTKGCNQGGIYDIPNEKEQKLESTFISFTA